MKNLVLALTIGALVGFTGCSTWESVQQRVSESDVTSQLVVNQITLRIIDGADNPQERAQRIREIIASVEDQIDGDIVARLDQLEAVVRSEIDWESLSLADQEIVNFALEKARLTLEDLIGDGVLEESDIETVSTLLRWIDNAAARVQ